MPVFMPVFMPCVYALCVDGFEVLQILFQLQLLLLLLLLLILLLLDFGDQSED